MTTARYFRGAAVITIVLALVLIAPPGHAGDVARGAKVSEEKCAKCHGKSGKGDGASLKKIDPDAKAADWTSKATMGKLSDADMVKIIKLGGKGVGKSDTMPGYQGKLTDAEVDDLLAFIRSLVK